VPIYWRAHIHPRRVSGDRIEALAAPDTINTIPEKTLLAFADHGRVKGVMPADGGDAEAVLQEFGRIGVNESDLAAELSA
jgi:transaldolase